MKLLVTLIVAAASVASFAQCPACGKEKQPSADELFLKQAREMEMAAEGKKACCRTTAEKSVEKGEAGCCNAKGEIAKFKVFVAGSGYKFFGCEDSAAQGRKELMASGVKVGQVQKVLGKVAI
ncbi:MAG: hypothetical protein BGO01_10090 [Armatimonadetes bacterium 55-13]|nr:hypothetical protein [Armatimonadota bacterium]OJU62749.1 MAG: hypothetical protein BGO01_10090 [Armatimonadetes bacterium 55-13]